MISINHIKPEIKIFAQSFFQVQALIDETRKSFFIVIGIPFYLHLEKNAERKDLLNRIYTTNFSDELITRNNSANNCKMFGT